MLHLYCIRSGEAPDAPAGLRGVDDEPVRTVAAGTLAAWVSAAADGPATVERMRAHDAVVREALRDSTPLPMRFGAQLAGEEAVRERIEERCEEYRAALERVAGCVEMAISIPLAAPQDETRAGGSHATEAGGPGRSYLEERRARLARQTVLAAAAVEVEQRVTEALGNLVRAGRSDLREEDGTVLAIAHLVRRQDLPAYRDAVVALERRDRLDLRASGPWAPYSFV